VNSKHKRTTKPRKQEQRTNTASGRKVQAKEKSPAGADTAPETRSGDKGQAQDWGSNQQLQRAEHTAGNLDLDLLEKATTQWQFGDWKSLAKLADKPLADHPDRARLALLTAAGLLQEGDREAGEEYVRLAREWGCETARIRRVLVAGVYNSLARARLLQGREADTARLTERACTTGIPGGEARLVVPARIAYQAAALGSPQPRLGLAFKRDGSLHEPRLNHTPDRQDTGSGASLIKRLGRILDRVTEGLVRSGQEFTLDGIRVFEAKDLFLPGKIALGLSYRVMSRAHNRRDLRKTCREFLAVDEITRGRKQETWGIYFYLVALSRLHRLGVLEEVFPADRLNELRNALDWRDFVDETTYDMRGRPHNYYGVAFSIAQLRAYLGWDDSSHAEILLQKMVEHYREYSGDRGFADETGGEGRYDRYSILLSAEIAHRFREADRALPAELQNWLRRSAEVVLVSLNRHGDGFQFGRSVGAYGDTAFLEILSAAAWHGLLSPVESRVAYAFSQRTTRKFLDFWYDDERQAVNLWEDGRRTDGYRGKNRILGETISLLHQHLYTHQIWEQLEAKNGHAMDAEFDAWIEQRPRFTLTRFSEQGYARAMLTARDGEHVFMLPLVNGADSHDRTAYYPVPFARGLIQAVPDECFPQLVPKLELGDGTVLMPLSFMRNITLNESADGATLTVEQIELDALGQKKPMPDSRIAVRTHYEFRPGCISRTDEFMPAEGIEVHGIELAFATDATGTRWDGTGVGFELGGVMRLDVEGYQPHAIEDVSDDPAFASPEGNIRTLVRWRLVPQMSDDTLQLSWSFHYPIRT